MTALPTLSHSESLTVARELRYLYMGLERGPYRNPAPWRREAVFWALSRLPPVLHVAAWRLLTLAAVDELGRALTPEEEGRRVDTAPPALSAWAEGASWGALRGALEHAAVLASGDVPFGTELEEDEPPPAPSHHGLLGPPSPALAARYLRGAAERMRQESGRAYDVRALWHLLFGADWPSFVLAWACLRLAAVRVYEPHDDPQEALGAWLERASREALLHALDEAAVIAEVCPPPVIT